MAIRQTATARKDVTPFINPTPVGIDSVITTLQKAFTAKLPWLTKSFGKAERMYNRTGSANAIRETDTSLDYFFPAVWVGQFKDPINMLADDNYDAYTFSFPVDSATPIDFEQNGQNRYNRGLAVIFWFNLPKIDSAKTYDFTEDLIIEIEKVIRSTPFLYNNGVEIESITDVPQDIFAEFSPELVENQRLIYPFRGCRFNLTTFYQSESNCV